MSKGLFTISSRFLHYPLLLTAAVLLCLVNLGGPSLWDRDEGRNATAAREMLDSGNWVVPTFNAQLRVDKPALLYWLQIMGYRFFGITEFAARLPSALAALLTVLLAYELGRKMFNPATGLLSGLILGSTPLFCGAARFANPDALLHFFSVLAFLFFWLGYTRGQLWFAALGLATGLGVLAKGPVGLVLPAAAAFLFLAWNRQLRLLGRWQLGVGLLVFLLVAMPWYIWVAVDTKANFLRGFLLHHNVNRFLAPMENHQGGIWYYPMVLALGFAPWSAFLAWGLWYGIKGVRHEAGGLRREGKDSLQPPASSLQPGENEYAAHRFLCCWVVVYLVFFTMAATKLPNYILPATVPLALWTGRFLERWQREALAMPAWMWRVSFAFLVLVGVMTGLGALLVSGIWEFSFLRGRGMPELQTWALIGLLPVLGASLAWWRWQRGDRAGTILVVLATAVLFVGPLAAWASLAFNHYKAPRPLVELAGAQQRQQDIRIGCWQLEYLPSLNFYCQRDVKHHRQEEEVLAFLRYPLPVFLFTPARHWQQLSNKVRGPYRILGRHPDMFGGDEVLVISNQ